MDRVLQARMFAAMTHSSVGQFRKYTNEPYVNHPIRVYELLKDHTDDEDMLCAALLHDVVEDCTTEEVSRQMLMVNILDAFGMRVLSLVTEVTDHFVSGSYPPLNRKQRKQAERERLAGVSPEAQTIKYCDILDNTADIMLHDPGFARPYVEEIHDLLEVMNSGNPQLYEAARSSTADAARKLAGLV